MVPGQDYVSYLLRLKCIRSSGQVAWAPSLESTATGEQRSFSGVEALIEFLQAEFDVRTDYSQGVSP